MHITEAGGEGRDALLATLAHELRNGIAPLGNALEVLARTSDPSARSLAIAMARRQLGCMNHLLAELGDFGLLAGGRVTLQRRRLVLQEIVGLAVQACRPSFEERRQQLTTEFAAAAVTVSADADRLWQVLVNLLNNAAKFTQPGGHVSVSVGCGDGGAEVRVADDGPGIAAEDLERIFGVLERGRGRCASPPGLGIGLAVVRRFVELHGGTIRASSAGEGQGATFTMRLPLTQPDLGAAATLQGAAAPMAWASSTSSSCCSR